jgi:esterase/lipase
VEFELVSKKVLKYLKIVSTVIITVILITVIGVSQWPTREFYLSKPFQLQDYESSKKSVEIRNSNSKSFINPNCADKLMEHGKKTEKVIVIFHGFTNCPQQFEIFGKQLFDKGYNVYIPRMPYHGHGNVLTDEAASFNVDQLIEFAEDSIQNAMGLGDKIDLLGISGGGLLATWAGFQLENVDKIMNIAPLYSPLDYPEWELHSISNILRILPNQYKWWDDKIQEKVEVGPKYAYPRYSLKAINAFLKLSLDLKKKLETQQNLRPNKKYILVTTENDKAINNKVAYNYSAKILGIPKTSFVSYQFPTELDLNHDIIDPNQRQAKIDKVYPKLLELFEK